MAIQTPLYLPSGNLARTPLGVRLLRSPDPVAGDCTEEQVRLYLENITFDTTNMTHPTLPTLRAIDKTAWQAGLQEMADYREGDNVLSNGSTCAWTFAASSAFGAPVVDSGTTAGAILGTDDYCEDPFDPDYCSGDLYLINNGLFNALTVQIIGPSAGVYSVRFLSLSFTVRGSVWPTCKAAPLCANDGQCVEDCTCDEDEAAVGFMCSGIPCTGYCNQSCWADYNECIWSSGPSSPPGVDGHTSWFMGTTTDIAVPGANPATPADFDGTYTFVKPGYTDGPEATIDLRFTVP